MPVGAAVIALAIRAPCVAGDVGARGPALVLAQAHPPGIHPEMFHPAVGLALVAVGVAYLGYWVWVRANRTRYEASLRSRLRPADVWLATPAATWSRTCWHCGEPCETRQTVRLTIQGSLKTMTPTIGALAASTSIELQVPICTAHGALRLGIYRGVRKLSTVAGIGVALVGPVLWGYGGVVYRKPGAAPRVAAVLLGAAVVIVGRVWAAKRETLRLRYLDANTGDAIVRFNDPHRAEAIRAEQVRAESTPPAPDGFPCQIELGRAARITSKRASGRLQDVDHSEGESRDDPPPRRE